MSEIDLQKRILETLEAEGSLSVSILAEKMDAEDSMVGNAVSELVDRNLVAVSDSKCENRVKSEAPIPISELAFRDELTPTQAVIRYLYEEQGYGQTQIGRILNYSPGNIQTNLDRIEKKLGRKINQNDEGEI